MPLRTLLQRANGDCRRPELRPSNIRSHPGYAEGMGQKLLVPVEGRAIVSPAIASPAIASPAIEGLTSAVLARDCMLPLLTPLAGLFPEGGLRRGTTVKIGPSSPGQSSPGQSSPGQSSPGQSSPGLTSLALALLSGPCASGSWCAVVGALDLGLVAAAQLGVALERLAVVPSPGPRWAVVTAALLEGFDLVLLQTAGRVSYSDARKLEARARERRSVLAVMGDGWPGTADVRLNIVAGRWCGLEDGCGHLWGREVE